MTKRTLLVCAILALLFSLGWSAKTKQPVVADTPKQSVDSDKPVIVGETDRTLVPSQPASPQAAEIPWVSVNGGGNLAMTSANYRMKASVGQSAIGYSTSTNYEMGIGFWYGATGSGCVAIAGDASANNTFGLNDVISIVNYAFSKPGCAPIPLCWLNNLLCRGDWTGDGVTTLADAIRGVNYIFSKPCAGPGTPPCCWKPSSVGVCCSPLPAPCGP